MPIDPDPEDRRKKEISWHAVFYHFRKWSRDGSLEQVRKGSILTISEALNLSELNIDGSHALAKKGGESVAYQGRSKAAIKDARKGKQPISCQSRKVRVLSLLQPV